MCILRIGGYEPENLLGKFHTTPKDRVEIDLDLNSKNIVVIHSGTLNLSDKPVEEM